jgi:prenyltransferase beta subunit
MGSFKGRSKELRAFVDRSFQSGVRCYLWWSWYMLLHVATEVAAFMNQRSLSNFILYDQNC